MLQDGLLVGGSTGEVVEGIVDGVEEAGVEGGGVVQVGMARVVSPSSGTEAVGSLLVGSKVGCLPGSRSCRQGPTPPKLSCVGEGVGSQKGGGGQDGQGLVGDRQRSPGSFALGILQEEDVLGDVHHALVVLAHLNGEQYHVQHV